MDKIGPLCSTCLHEYDDHNKFNKACGECGCGKFVAEQSAPSTEERVQRLLEQRSRLVREVWAVRRDYREALKDIERLENAPLRTNPCGHPVAVSLPILAKQGLYACQLCDNEHEILTLRAALEVVQVTHHQLTTPKNRKDWQATIYQVDAALEATKPKG